MTKFSGGLHRGLQLSGVDAQIVAAFDWDRSACEVYDANHDGGLSRKVGSSSKAQRAPLIVTIDGHKRSHSWVSRSV